MDMTKKLVLATLISVSTLFGYDSEVKSVIIAPSSLPMVKIGGKLFYSDTEYFLQDLEEDRQDALLQAVEEHSNVIEDVQFETEKSEPIDAKCYSLTGAFIGQNDELCMSLRPDWIDENGNSIPEDKR